MHELVGKFAIGMGAAFGVGLVLNFQALLADRPLLQVIGVSGVAAIVSLGAACLVAQRRTAATA